MRAIQLGGKGYAPAESDPLRKHVKGLSDFVQFLDNLDEMLGEIPDPRYTTQPNAALFKLLQNIYSRVEVTDLKLIPSLFCCYKVILHLRNRLIFFVILDVSYYSSLWDNDKATERR